MAQRTLICLYPAHGETDYKKVDRETQTSREKNYSVEEHMQLLPQRATQTITVTSYIDSAVTWGTVNLEL